MGVGHLVNFALWTSLTYPIYLAGQDKSALYPEQYVKQALGHHAEAAEC
jgi:hypothetical protein